MRHIAVVILSLILPTSLLAAEHTGPAKKAKATATAKQTVTFESKLVDGKKTWLPAEVHVKEGTKVDLKLVNTLPEPHGFEIVGLTEKIVVNNGETKTLENAFVAKSKGRVEVKCHLHPAHVGAVIVVD